MLNAAKDGQKIYGLTVGVGLNKDKKFVDAKGNFRCWSYKSLNWFYTGLIYAHCGGISEDIPLKTARAVLVTRLINLLYAGAGVLINLMQKVKNENR